MVTVKYAEMEAFCESMRALAGQSEEVFELVWRFNNEITCDADLLLLPQAQQILQKLQNAVNHLMAADDMLQSMRTITDILPNGYRDLEEKMRYSVYRIEDNVGYMQKEWEREMKAKPD